MPRVSIEDLNKTIEVDQGDTVYNSLFEKGIELPHGCLAGSCGACRIEVIDGYENLESPSLIEKNTIEGIIEEFFHKKGPEYLRGKEIRLACRAKIKGDVCIKPFK
jgi:ferredoxin